MVSHYYTKTPPPFQAFQTENPAECTAHSIFCRMIPSLTYISMWFSKQPRHSRIFSPGCCFLENFFYKIYDIISIPKMITYKINPGFRYTYFLYGVGHPFWRPICHQ